MLDRKQIAARLGARLNLGLLDIERRAADIRRVSKSKENAFQKGGLKRQRPPWADQIAIDALYLEARRLTRDTGIAHQVDHEIPLRGKLVSGLHIETNMRIITAFDNGTKKNKFEVE